MMNLKTFFIFTDKCIQIYDSAQQYFIFICFSIKTENWIIFFIFGYHDSINHITATLRIIYDFIIKIKLNKPLLQSNSTVTTSPSFQLRPTVILLVFMLFNFCISLSYVVTVDEYLSKYTHSLNVSSLIHGRSFLIFFFSNPEQIPMPPSVFSAVDENFNFHRTTP